MASLAMSGRSSYGGSLRRDQLSTSQRTPGRRSRGGNVSLNSSMNASVTGSAVKRRGGSRKKKGESGPSLAERRGARVKHGTNPILPGKLSPTDGRVYLNYSNLKTLDVLGTHQPRLEFLYARDNYLRSFQGLGYMPILKILDVSSNCLESLDFLGVLPNLRELYLNANMLTTLEDLPTLPSLQVLSVCQNEIESLEYMQTQPSLRCLFIAYNNIHSLSGCPPLPAIESIRTSGNPLEDSEQFALTLLIACGDTLRKVNGEPIDEQLREFAQETFSAVDSIAVRRGWMVDMGDSRPFLLEQQRIETEESGTGLVLLEASIMGYALEGNELAAQMSFEFEGMELNEVAEGPDAASGLYFDFQWLRGTRNGYFEEIEGACLRSYRVAAEDVGCALKVECTPVIDLDMDEFGETVFAVTETVEPAEPRALSARVVGVFVEGETVEAVTEYRGGTEGQSLFSWFRCPPNVMPTLIAGAEERTYSLTLDDVDCTLRVEYTPVRSDNVQGDPILGSTPPIDAAPPSVTNVGIEGELVEDEVLVGYGRYFGGHEGPSQFQWYRAERNSDQTFRPIPHATTETYRLSAADVDRYLRFEYTPVDRDSLTAGVPSAAVTEGPVAPCPPAIHHLRLEADSYEESYPIFVVGDYFGGVEGRSQITWSRTLPGEGGEWEVLPDARGKEYTPTSADVGYVFRVDYLPVRVDGKVGRVQRAVSSVPVAPTRPRLVDLRFVGTEVREGVLLMTQETYRGGDEGASKFQWYRSVDEDGKAFELIEGSTDRSYTPTLADVGCFLKFNYTPVRKGDGAVGDQVAVVTSEPVLPGVPSFSNVRVEGDLVEGSTLSFEALYFGGTEGMSEFRWFRVDAEHKRTALASRGPTLVLTAAEVGCSILVHALPVRENDGARGDLATAEAEGTVAAGPPAVSDLEVVGDVTVGSTLQLRYTYSGGAEGTSVVTWYRVANVELEHILPPIPVMEGHTYVVAEEDRGAVLKVVYTPARDDGAVGSPAEARTEPVPLLPPSVVDVRILANDSTDVLLAAPPSAEGADATAAPAARAPVEGERLCPIGSFVNGTEGESKFRWLSRAPGSDAEPEVVCEEREYTPTLNDVGRILTFEWTPIRVDGDEGEPVCLAFDVSCEPGFPRVDSVEITSADPSDPLAVRTGHGTYFGGFEGASKLDWFSNTPNGPDDWQPLQAIPGQPAVYQPTPADVGRIIVFQYTPVRSDGVEGAPVLSEPTDAIEAGPPWATDLQIVNADDQSVRIEERQIVRLKGVYSENINHENCLYAWYRGEGTDTPLEEAEGVPATSYSYVARASDVGSVIRLDFTPVDTNGVRGETVTALSQPVEAALPRVENFGLRTLNGAELTSDATLKIIGQYVGGRSTKRPRVSWARRRPDETTYHPNSVESRVVHVCTADDIGYIIQATYTPVREDEVVGEPVSAEVGPITPSAEIETYVRTFNETGEVSFIVSETVAGGRQESRTILLTRDKIKIRNNSTTIEKASYSTDVEVTLPETNHAQPTANVRFTLVISTKVRPFKFMATSKEEADAVVYLVRVANSAAAGMPARTGFFC